MTEREPSTLSQTSEATGAETATGGEAQASGGSFSASGAIPAVSAAAGSSSPSASDRAFGAHAASMHHPHGIPGGDRNVSMEHINAHHRAGGQSTRLAIGGKTPVVASATHVYGNDGTELAPVGPGPLSINAGQICHLEIAGHKVPCVFTHGGTPGWVPVSAFAHGQEIAQLQEQQSHAIDGVRHAGHDRARGGHVRVVEDRPTPPQFEKLFTKPHQQADTANHAHDYFLRGAGMANLLLNLPTWTKQGAGVGERFGSAVDLVHVGSQFHQLEGPVQVPLYHHNSEQQAGHPRLRLRLRRQQRRREAPRLAERISARPLGAPRMAHAMLAS
jgi:hypothetical protein